MKLPTVDLLIMTPDICCPACNNLLNKISSSKQRVLLQHPANQHCTSQGKVFSIEPMTIKAQEV
jgi:hypothetical protein